MIREGPGISDPLIDEVRERRRQVWAKYDHDLTKVFEAIKQLQAQHPEKLAVPKRKPRAPSSAKS